MSNIPQARNSKCWNCIYGLCIQETEQEQHAIFSGANPDGNTDTEFQLFEGQSPPAMPEITEHTVEQERVKTLCFWRPKDIENAPPILISFVKDCSRFQART